MEVTDFGDTYIEGKIHATAEGIMTTSVLNEEGWHLQIDGKDREIKELVGGVLIAEPLSIGDHTVRLSFRPPGLIAGCVLLLLAAAALVLDAQLRQRRIRRRSRSGISGSGI